MTSYTKIIDSDLASGALYDKVNDMADALNAGKAEKTSIGFRKASTAYLKNDTVPCEYHGELLLRCSTAGTTAVGALDTSGALTVGTTITDGTVVWTVVRRGYVRSVNNTAADSNGNVTIQIFPAQSASTAGKVITSDGETESWETPEVTTEMLATKADKDFANLDSTAVSTIKSIVAGVICPAWTSAGTSYSSGQTLPSNGFVYAFNGSNNLYVNGYQVAKYSLNAGSGWDSPVSNACIYARAGDVITGGSFYFKPLDV